MSMKRSHKELLTSLAEVQRVLAERETGKVNPESLSKLEKLIADVERERAMAAAMLTALLHDKPVPITVFKPWASRQSFYTWSREGRLNVERINKKNCVKPSEFFALLETIRPRPKPKEPTN